MLAERLTAQLLSGPRAHDPVAVAERLLAVQAQDQRGFRLAVRARTAGLTAADVERALAERSLVVSWLNRGTLHLVRGEDYPWLHALTTPPLSATVERRLRQLGVSASETERGISTVERELARDGPLVPDALRAALRAAGVPVDGQAFVHILFAATLRGLVVRGPVVEGRHAYVLVRDWLGGMRTVDRELAHAELARRYLAGHGPADDRDLARWAGLPLRDARSGLAAIAGELAEHDGLVDLARRPAAAELPPPRLLGAFDPVLLGWRSREPILGEHGDVVTRNGVFRPFALVDGRAVATWAFPRGEVKLEPFGALDAAARARLADDAEDVQRFLAG